MEGQKKLITAVDEQDLNKYLRSRLVEPYLPKDLVEDWSIFGSIVSNVYGPSGILPPEYKDNDLKLWLLHKLQVKALLKYVQWKIFSNSAMLNNRRPTDNVLTRIFVSKLNNLELPKVYADEIFDNFHLQYVVRKPVFEDYFVIKVLGLPFGYERKECPF